MNNLLCCIFTDIPGAGKNWTLAVIAISVVDARQYVKNVHHGGKLVNTIRNGGNITASCGATTEKAQRIIRQKNELLLKG